MLIVRAPAKVNLTLDVLGRRPDGYHALRSVMQALELHDTLELTLHVASEIVFECDVPALRGDANLVVRAARLLREHTGYGGGAHITLRKRIPIDAGLGGGSSDAAATLRGLAQLWDLDLSPVQLAELGARLGSDVPFFFYAPTALVSGRGEYVEPLPPIPPVHVVLHKPEGGVSTARVFAALPPARYGDGGGTDRLLTALREGRTVEEWPLSNGLQETVADLYPDVAAALTRLAAAGATHPILTGSGSTVYALFADRDRAQQVCDRLVTAGHAAMLTRSG